MTKSKQWSAIAPVWYSVKMQTCIIDSELQNPFRGSLKIHFDEENENWSENFLLKKCQFY